MFLRSFLRRRVDHRRQGPALRAAHQGGLERFHRLLRRHSAAVQLRLRSFFRADPRIFGRPVVDDLRLRRRAGAEPQLRPRDSKRLPGRTDRLARLLGRAVRGQGAGEFRACCSRWSWSACRCSCCSTTSPWGAAQVRADAAGAGAGNLGAHRHRNAVQRAHGESPIAGTNAADARLSDDDSGADRGHDRHHQCAGRQALSASAYVSWWPSISSLRCWPWFLWIPF